MGEQTVTIFDDKLVFKENGKSFTLKGGVSNWYLSTILLQQILQMHNCLSIVLMNFVLIHIHDAEVYQTEIL